jgi:hypothetical protein
MLTPARRFYIILGGITLAGLILRLKGLGSESLTADEASALLRLQFPGFMEMINGGVRPDGHPAFTQALLWFWTKIFGIGEFAIRFPFALFGTASIWLAGMIAKKWFNENTAFVTASAIAFLQFPLMYSQLARPYAPGLFFTLLAAWFLTAFLQNEKARKRGMAGFAIAAALAAYSHYFSLLAVALMSVGGLFLVPAANRKYFLVACAAAVLLFVPHFSITIDQVKIGGVGGPGGWLGEPTPLFVKNHLLFAFNKSRGLLALVLIVWLIGFVFLFRRRITRMHVFVFLLWFLPLATGYAYSILRNPVLQDSVLLFGFPFLLMFLFGWLAGPGETRFSRPVPYALMFCFFIYTAFYKPFHLTDHFGRLRELVSTTIDWQERFGAGNVSVVYNVDAPYFVNYYYDKFEKKPEHILATIANGFSELRDFRKLVQSSTGDYFIYGWSTRSSPPEALEIIREKYPVLLSKRYWFNSAVYVFGKIQLAGMDGKDPEIFSTLNEFVPPDTIRRFETVIKPGDPFKLVADWKPAVKPESFEEGVPCAFGSACFIQLDSSQIYTPGLRMRLGDVIHNPDNAVLFSAGIMLLDPNAHAQLVIEFEREGKQLHWYGMETSAQTEPVAGFWQPVYFGIPLPADLRTTDVLHVYCYSMDGKAILVDNLYLRTTTGHTAIYGPRADYE